jgi:hypothetical protein
MRSSRNAVVVAMAFVACDVERDPETGRVDVDGGADVGPRDRGPADGGPVADPDEPELALRRFGPTVVLLGEPVSVPILASGGTPPYAFSAAEGAPPPGIRGSPAEDEPDVFRLSGAPEELGDFEVTIQVRDSAGDRASLRVALSVRRGPRIETDTLPPGTVGEAYATELGRSEGPTSNGWSVVAGELPPGLELVAEDGESEARLEGVPELAGDFTFELEVRGREGGRDRRGFVLAVAEPLQVLTSVLPPGVLGETYAATAVPAGGRGPVRWVFDSDALVPPGIRIRREQRVVHFEGRTGAIGRFVLPVEIEDADGRTASSVLVLEVVDSGFRLKIDGPLSLRVPACTPFEATWEAVGGGRVGRSWTVTAPSTISIEENPDSVRATGFFDPQAPNATVELEVKDANLESDSVTAVLEVAPSTVERHGAVIHRNTTTAATRFDLIDLCHVVPELAKSGGFSVSRALSELTFSPDDGRLAFAHEGSSGEPKISVFEMARTPPTRQVFTVPDLERGPWFATDRFLLFQQKKAVEVRPGATFDFLRFFVIDLDASNPEPRPIDLDDVDPDTLPNDHDLSSVSDVGGLIVLEDGRGGLWVVDLAAPEDRDTIELDCGQAGGLSSWSTWSPQAALLVYRCTDGSVGSADLSGGRLVQLVPGPDFGSGTTWVPPDNGRWLVTLEGDSVRWTDLDARHFLARVDVVTSVAFDLLAPVFGPKSRSVAIRGGDGDPFLLFSLPPSGVALSGPPPFRTLGRQAGVSPRTVFGEFGRRLYWEQDGEGFTVPLDPPGQNRRFDRIDGIRSVSEPPDGRVFALTHPASPGSFNLALYDLTQLPPRVGSVPGVRPLIWTRPDGTGIFYETSGTADLRYVDLFRSTTFRTHRVISNGGSVVDLALPAP